MARNSFKKLEEEEFTKYPGAPPRIKSNIQSEIGVIKMMGQLVEVYLPKVFEFFVLVAGGKPEKMMDPRNQKGHRHSDLGVRGTDAHEDLEGFEKSILPDDSKPPGGPGRPDIDD